MPLKVTVSEKYSTHWGPNSLAINFASVLFANLKLSTKELTIFYRNAGL